MAEQNLGKVAITTAGAYDSSVEYGQLTIVTYGGESWLSRTTVPVGNPPSEDSDYWQLILSPKIERKEMTSTSASINPNTFYVWGEVASLDITLNEGASAEENRYMFQFRNPKSGATVLTLPDDILWSVDTELGDDGLPLFGKGEYTRIEIIEGLASVKKWALPYIIFADAEVERVLLANGVGDGIGITKQDAAAVTDIGTWFQGNATITSFNELRFFTNLSRLGYNNSDTAAFMGCSMLKSILLPASVNYIGIHCFSGCDLQEVPDLSLITTLREGAFSDNTNMRGKLILNVPPPQGSFTNTGIDEAVINCTGTISAGSNNTTNGAFANCTNLAKVDISDGVTLIRQYTFHNCSSLATMIVRAVTPPTLNGPFIGTAIAAGTGTIYVPDESVEAYKTAINWSTYAAQIKGISELPTE